MIIYQIIKSVGCYEDYHEYVVNTFLYKEKAERELERLKAESPDCYNCLYAEEGQKQPIKTVCPFHKPKYVNFAGYEPFYDCQSRIDEYDLPDYKIKVFGVDEGQS